MAFVRMPQSKAGMPKEKPKLTLNNDCLKHIIRGKKIRKEKKNKKGVIESRECFGEEIFIGERRSGIAVKRR